MVIAERISVKINKGSSSTDMLGMANEIVGIGIDMLIGESVEMNGAKTTNKINPRKPKKNI